MAPSSPKVSAPSNASTLPTTHTTSATPRSPPDCRSTDPGTVKIPDPIVVPTTMRTRSRSVRTRGSSVVIYSGTRNSWVMTIVCSSRAKVKVADQLYRTRSTTNETR